MDAVKLAIQRLQNDPKIRKARTVGPDVEDAVSQLSSTVILFELSTTSDCTFIRLTELLRGRLLPLYRTSLLLTLDYIVAIFCFVHQHKLLIIKYSEEAKLAWESVLESLLSGVLDFLEENASSKHRETVASALYPILCPLFFCGPGVNSVDFNGNLLSTVYQLLMTTVEATPRNTLKLRGTALGSKHLGLTIAQTKEFLAMESLLELFALLIPPLKGGRAKRTQFIKEVFDPSIFDCSDTVTGILEDIANPDWSVTSTEIMKALAESDIMFPQPFEVSRLTMNKMQIETSSFYIDKSKFVANVDEDGKIETLHIPFSSVWKISTSTPTNGEAQVTIRIMKPPVLGDQPLKVTAAENLSISWQLEHKLLERFGKALKKRNLKSVDTQPRRKQSKAEEISLDFQSEKEESLALRRDKVQSLSQLWADKTPSSKIKNQVNSTPLVSLDSPDFDLDSKPKPQAKVENVAEKLVEGIKPGATVFVDSNGEFSFEPYMKLKEARSNNQKDNRESVKPTPPADENETQCDDSSEDEIPIPKSKTTKSRGRIISLSDDDDDDIFDVPGKRMDDNSRVATDIAIVTSVDDHKALQSPARKPLQVTKPSMKSEEPPRFMKQSDKDEAREQNQGYAGIAPVVEPSKRSRRKSIDITEDGNRAANSESARHSKRLRLETNNSPTVSDHPFKGVKYGRKGRTSSPVPSEFNFDEFPRITKEPKKSSMKGKNGTTVVSTKRAPIKKVGKVTEKKPECDIVQLQVQRQVDTDPDKTLINLDAQNIIANNQEEKPHRRSARVATIQTSKEKPGQKADIASAPKKLKKAPWEETDFMQKKDMPSAITDDFGRNEKPKSKIEDGPHTNLAHEDGSESSNHENSFGNAGQTTLAERYTEFTVPTKPGLIFSDPKEDSEIVMIDLTHDVSPKRPPFLKASAFDKGKKNPTVKIDLSMHTATRPQALPNSDSSNPRICLDLHREAVSVKNPKENTTSKSDLSDDVVIDRSPQSAPTEGRAALHKPAFIPQEASPPPRQWSSAPSQVKIDKMESFKDIIPNERLSLSRASLTPLDIKIKKMQPLNHITDDDEHNRRSSVKFDVPEIGKNSRRWDSTQDRIQSRSQTSATKDYQREMQYHDSQSSPIKKTRQARNNNITFEPAIQPMDKIIDILTEINDGLIDKVALRFEGVSTKLHTGRRMILEGTAQRLKEMSDESIHHFNGLVDLEAEYTTHCSGISNGVHDFRKSTEQLNQCFKNILIEHSTRSLCKKFPSTLFPKLPQAISNPGVRR